MKLFDKNNKKDNEIYCLPMGNKNRHVLTMYAALVPTLDCLTATAFAASDPLTVINNLSEFIFNLIRTIGMILLSLNVMRADLPLKPHDPNQRANGFPTLVGGVIVAFARGISTLVTG